MEEKPIRPKIFQPDEPSPAEALNYLETAFANGLAVKITPLRTELPIDEAADAIDMSGRDLRAYAAAGEVVFRSTEYTDWVQLADVVDFNERLGVRRRAALDEMLRESVYDEDD